jgi:hypothetical protein
MGSWSRAQGRWRRKEVAIYPDDPDPLMLWVDGVRYSGGLLPLVGMHRLRWHWLHNDRIV